MKNPIFFLIFSVFAFGQNTVRDTILSNSKAVIFKFDNHKVYFGNSADLHFSKTSPATFKATGNNIDFVVYFNKETKEPTKQIKDAMLVVNKCKADEITCSIGFDKVDDHRYFNNTYITKDFQLNDSYVVYLKDGGSIGIGFTTKVPKEYADKKAELVDSFRSLIENGLIIRENYYSNASLHN